MTKKKYLFLSVILSILIFGSGFFVKVNASTDNPFIKDYINWNERMALHSTIFLEQRNELNNHDYSKSIVAWFGDNIDFDIIWDLVGEPTGHLRISVKELSNGTYTTTLFDNGWEYDTVKNRYFYQLSPTEKNRIKKILFNRDYNDISQYVEFTSWNDYQNTGANTHDFNLKFEIKFKLGLDITMGNISMLFENEALNIPDAPMNYLLDIALKLFTKQQQQSVELMEIKVLENYLIDDDYINLSSHILSYNFQNLTNVSDISLSIQQRGNDVINKWSQGKLRLYEISLFAENQVYLYDYDIPTITDDGFNFNLFEQKICEGFDLMCILQNAINWVSYIIFKAFDSTSFATGFASFFNSLLAPFNMINNASLRSLLMLFSGMLPIFVLIKVWRRLT